MRLRRADALMVPFSLLWGGFAFFWEYEVLRSGADLFGALWGIPFVLVGVYIIVGRFWFDAGRRARTTYAVTTERIIITSRGFGATTKSLNLRTLSDLTLEEGSAGEGTISFGPPAYAGRFGSGGWRGMPTSPSFEMIPDARRVYTIIRDAQRAASGQA